MAGELACKRFTALYNLTCKYSACIIMRSFLPAIVTLCGLLTVVDSVFAQGLTFTTNSYAVGTNARSVAAADVNGDGKLDLISANFGAGTLTVLTNNGSGIFGSNATCRVGNYPISVTAADVNGDGKPDLISANYGISPPQWGNTLTVLTNNGNGVFGSNATLVAGGYGCGPHCVVAADTRGSGKLDLICANLDASTLTVLTNNGSGIFGSNATYNVGGAPYCVVAADINHDGKLDLISANDAAGTLTVLTNNGSGIFGYNATYNVGSAPACVVAADINNDGKPDLISANYGANTLTVLTNNGSGVFVFNATLNLDAGSDPIWVTAADVNGDGKPDLISANYFANTLTVLTNNGSGVFGFNTTLPACPLPGSSYPFCVVAADVNGDGILNLISASVNSGIGFLTVLTQFISVPPPALSIVPTNGSSLVLSWSSSSPGFSILTNSDLTTTNWVPAGYAISANGTNQSSILTPPLSGNLFFRLSHP